MTFASGVADRIESPTKPNLYAAIAAMPLAACALCAILPILIRLVLLLWVPAPVAWTHDEFSYLLGADTFAHGRLTNPPHPMWEHFESFHILQQPTYASKYPPMQALVLAFGQVLGHPWIGVLLSAALMCGTICWAMQGWLSPVVALTGGLLVSLRLGTLTYWTNSYWGGAAAAIGGALVIGALPRLLKEPGRRTAFALGIGLVILANTRPYEGLMLAAPTLMVLIVVSIRNGSFRSLLRCAAIPVMLTLGIAALAMGFYNYRVTHHWLLMPYQLHEQQYAVSSAFLWQAPKNPPQYHHVVMQEFWAKWDLQAFVKAKAQWVRGYFNHLDESFGFLVGSGLFALALIVIPRPGSGETDRLTFPILVVALLGFLPEKGVEPHYLAPIAALVYIRLMDTFAALLRWRPANRPVGPVLGLLAYEFVLLQVLFLIPIFWNTPRSGFAIQRVNTERKLEQSGGRHLVIVRYSSTHSPHQEWVYNRADIDSSPVVWARDMGEQRNGELLSYFSNRTAWLIEPDKPGAPLAPIAAR